MASPMPDIDPDEISAPLPCSRYPQCRQECTWPACNEKPPVDQAAAWAEVLDRLEQLRRDRRPPTWRVRAWRRVRGYLRRPGGS
jgi:hypothetical protein